MDRQIKAGDISGGVTLVARHGKIAHLEADGVMDLQSSKPVAMYTMYRVASMSKPITALAVLMLVGEGKARLSDPVSAYLPSFAKQVVAVPKGASPRDGFDTVPVKRPITVKDLRTHTSGFHSGAYSILCQIRHAAGPGWGAGQNATAGQAHGGGHAFAVLSQHRHPRPAAHYPCGGMASGSA